MAPAKVQLKAVEKPPSSARAKLGAAISARNELQRKVSAVIAASETAGRDARSLQDDLTAAKAELAAAEQKADDDRINEAMNKPVVSGKSPATARKKLADLEDKISATKSARQILNAQLNKTQLEFERAKADVAAAVNEVIRDSPELERLLSDWMTVVSTYRQMKHLLDKMPLVSDSIRCLPNALNNASDFELADRWAVAIRALQDNAAAELP